jgi:hypothetical protein
VKSLDGGSFIFLLLYVDGILIAARSITKANNLKALLSKEFDMNDLGTAKKDGDSQRQRCQEIVAISGRLCEEGVGEV